MSDSRFDEVVFAVQRAGAMMMRLWPGATGNQESLGVQSKSDGSPVSQADFESNEIILAALKRLFPDDAVLSEESPIEKDALARASRVWIVDPLDGTSSFVQGRDDFSILVALSVHRKPIFGVMFFPARDILVVAERGHGVTRNGTPLKVSQADTLRPGMVYLRNFECSRPELGCSMRDSGLALYQVACGELDGAIIRMKTHQEWDLAAPMVVLLEAGGVVSDQTGGEVPCGSGSIDFQYFIASNGLVHQQLQGVIQD